MIKRTLAIACAGTALSLSIGLPLSAQIEDTPDVVEDESTDVVPGEPGEDGFLYEDGPTIIDQDELLDDETGLPDGGSPEDSGLPDAGEVLSDDVIIIDGRAYQYDRSVLERLLQEGGLTPVEADALNTTETGTVGEDPAEDGGMVTYPPADSVEDLEPEDILE